MQRRDTGRPEIAYGRKCPLDQLEHEARFTDFALMFPEERFEREVSVGRTKADGMMTRKGRRCFIEIDNTGKMTVAQQMRTKWDRYGRIDGFILVVATSEKRMHRLIKGAEPVKDVALFTTFERLRSNAPEPWVDFFGRTARI